MLIHSANIKIFFAGVCEGWRIPLVFILCSNRRTSTYNTIFEQLKKAQKRLKPKTINYTTFIQAIFQYFSIFLFNSFFDIFLHFFRKWCTETMISLFFQISKWKELWYFFRINSAIGSNTKWIMFCAKYLKSTINSFVVFFHMSFFFICNGKFLPWLDFFHIIYVIFIIYFVFIKIYKLNWKNNQRVMWSFTIKTNGNIFSLK